MKELIIYASFAFIYWRIACSHPICETQHFHMKCAGCLLCDKTRAGGSIRVAAAAAAAPQPTPPHKRVLVICTHILRSVYIARQHRDKHILDVYPHVCVGNVNT